MNQMLPYLVLAVIISSITTYFATSISLEKTLKETKAPITSDIAIVGKDNQTKIKGQQLESGVENKSKLPVTGENAEFGESCSESCDDGNSCTFDYCNKTTNYKCVHTTLRGEVEGCKGLVQGTCSKYSCVSGNCILIYSSVCCGNGKCDADENFSFCPSDCQQQTSQTSLGETTQSTQSETTQTIQSQQTQSLAVTISVANNPIVRGHNQTITIKVTDGSNPVAGSSISSTVKYASGSTKKDFSGTTNANGDYSYTWAIGGSSTVGTFSVTATTTKAGYTSGSASTSFQVIAAS